MIDSDDFLGRVADILEVPAVTPELEFRTVPGWGSMMGFALYIMLEDEYGVKITPERFRGLRTVDSLMAEANRQSPGA
jgi:acyl carrier protein